MKGMLKIVTVIMLIVALVPGWLYASGNLPSLFPRNESIIKAFNSSFPELANATFRESHRGFEKLRNAGIAVPYTYNEQLSKITRVRNQAIRICNNILLDQ
jgi:hypothetical protein